VSYGGVSRPSTTLEGQKEPGQSGGAAAKSPDEPKETDAQFQQLLDRVTVALGRLQFLTEA